MKVIRTRKHHKTNGVPLKIQKYVRSNIFNKRPIKWDLLKSAYIEKHDWILENNNLTRLGIYIETNSGYHEYSEEQLLSLKV